MWMWSWPDQGVPESARSLLALLSCVHSVWMCGQSPLVVHCSAGMLLGGGGRYDKLC